MEIATLQAPSFLYARDPSILAYNGHGLKNQRLFSEKELDSTELSGSEDVKDSNHIHVYLRIKGEVSFKNLYEISNENVLICKVPQGSHVLRNVKETDRVTKKYSFTKIFGPDVKQINIFNSIVKPKILKFINGKNSTLLTYGASGSGKTFTIVGTALEPGLVPRALEYLFRTLPNLSEVSTVKPLPNGNITVLDESKCRQEKQHRLNILNTSVSTIDKASHIRTYKDMQKRLSEEPVATIDDASRVSFGVWVSFAEIYNEYVYDLLQPPLPRGKQRPKLPLGNAHGKTYIKNLTSINVSSGVEAYQILQYGINNLNYAATSVNSHSSRSHSIFTIKLAQATYNNEWVHVSYFNFCDLAGSERLKKTLNVGDRLKESNNINTSLLVLGRCINSVRAAQKQCDNRLIPFRESKLTQLFQRALSGLEDILMIVNINPSRDMFDESQHVLNFSAIAQDIIVEEQTKMVKQRRVSRFSQYMQGRNTEIKSIPEEDEAENYNLIISELMNELEQQKVESEEREKMERDRIIHGYQQIIKNKEAMWNAKLEEVQRKYHEKYEAKSKQLKFQYEELYKHEVIDLDSSTEENSNNGMVSVQEVEEIKNLKEENQILSMTVEDLKTKNATLLSDQLELQDKLHNLEIDLEANRNEVRILCERNLNLTKTLNDAEVEFNDMTIMNNEIKQKYTKLLSEKYECEEKIDTLESQLNAHTKELAEAKELIEELEGVKEKYDKLMEEKKRKVLTSHFNWNEIIPVSTDSCLSKENSENVYTCENLCHFSPIKEKSKISTNEISREENKEN